MCGVRPRFSWITSTRLRIGGGRQHFDHITLRPGNVISSAAGAEPAVDDVPLWRRSGSWPASSDRRGGGACRRRGGAEVPPSRGCATVLSLPALPRRRRRMRQASLRRRCREAEKHQSSQTFAAEQTVANPARSRCEVTSSAISRSYDGTPNGRAGRATLSRRLGRAVADDQFGGQQLVTGALQHPNEIGRLLRSMRPPRRGPCRDILANRGERWAHALRQRVVVEPDDRQIARDIETSGQCGLDHAIGDHIAEAQDGRRALRPVEQDAAASRPIPCPNLAGSSPPTTVGVMPAFEARRTTLSGALHDVIGGGKRVGHDVNGSDSLAMTMSMRRWPRSTRC